MEISPELVQPFERMMSNRPETLGTLLGMQFLKVTKDELVMTMPVDHRTIQPFGLLHGGASVALAETAASVGAWLNLESPDGLAVGIEINANHLRSVRSGFVTATAKPVYRGRTLQVWQIEITDQQQRLVCTSRCTLAIKSPRQG
jgi:uncharacterized protein (TIGR00369 family)